MLGDEKTDGTEAWALASGTFGAYVVTDGPDELYERAIDAGATLVRGLNDTPYGSREFSVSDPEGNRWSFGTYRGADQIHDEQDGLVRSVRRSIDLPVCECPLHFGDERGALSLVWLRVSA